MKEKSHNKKKEVKALIIRDILRRELSGQDLRKSEIEEDMKGLGIPKPNFEFHLYSKKKHQEGLIPKKVIKSKKGNLTLNLKSLKSLAIIFEYLENDREYGERIRYLLDRAFKEAFYSKYGDMLINEWRLVRLLYKERDKLQEKYKFGDHIRSKVYYDIYDIRDEIFYELYERVFPEYSFEPSSALRTLPQAIAEGPLKGIDAVLSELDLLGLLVEFAESLRGDHSLEFKIAYIIKALEMSEWVRELETRKDGSYELLELADVSLLFQDNDDIMDLSNTRDEIFRMFVERVIKKALSENVSMDRSLKAKDSILKLFFIEDLENTKSEIRGKVSHLLNSYLFLNPKTLEEFNEIGNRREELGFKYNHLLA